MSFVGELACPPAQTYVSHSATGQVVSRRQAETTKLSFSLQKCRENLSENIQVL